MAPTGAILAGGASRRFGGKPKGLERVGDARLIDRVHAALAPVCADVVMLANDADAAAWLPGTRVVADLHPGAGGLAGVHAALTLGHDVLVVAWDMPFVTAHLLASIVAAARGTDAEICAPESESPHGIEPFCAFYRRDVAKPLDEFLVRGGGPARDFLGQRRTHRMPLEQVAQLGDPATLLLSVNTADDLTRARALAHAES